jgi:hypothetical protein
LSSSAIFQLQKHSGFDERNGEPAIEETYQLTRDLLQYVKAAAIFDARAVERCACRTNKVLHVAPSPLKAELNRHRNSVSARGKN